jgi:GT2 family glycosyltransferase
MRISCSVVCYHNAPEQVAQVLHSLVSGRATADVVLRIYLVDNSSDNTLAALAAQFGAIYLALPHNPGFGTAHNCAIRDAMAHDADYHVVLNPDICFGSDVLGTLVDYMEQQRDIGLLMPKVQYPDGRRQNLCKLLPSPADLLLRRFLPTLFRLSGRLATYELHHSGYDHIMDVPSLSGCFMLLRVAVLREVGGFDERFFMYLEDVDLTRRIARHARTTYFPHVSIVHEYGKGSYKSITLLFHHISSAIRYFNKWGWFQDEEKRAINQTALLKIHSAKSAEKSFIMMGGQK